MCIGVFVQLNEGSRKGRACPIGYIIQEDGCWEWVGATRGSGYGHLWFGGRIRPAHQVVYEKAKGAIPDGLELDHLCRNPSCVNPDHLEAVTHKENMRRSVSPIAKTGENASCPYGHPYTAANTYWRPDGEGRQCRVCIRVWKENRRSKQCPQGHVYSDGTAYWRPKVGPICLLCHPNFRTSRNRSAA